ncbi:hypothetical protein MOSE0_N00694 [Monosporozyma servazzii]
METQQDNSATSSTARPSTDRLSNNNALQGEDTTTARDWQRKLIVQGKELDRVRRLNEFLELERRIMK